MFFLPSLSFWNTKKHIFSMRSKVIWQLFSLFHISKKRFYNLVLCLKTSKLDPLTKPENEFSQVAQRGFLSVALFQTWSSHLKRGEWKFFDFSFWLTLKVKGPSVGWFCQQDLTKLVKTGTFESSALNTEVFWQNIKFWLILMIPRMILFSWIKNIFDDS